ncbi:DNA repair protein RecO [Gammaproteobacteria bacterium AS21]
MNYRVEKQAAYVLHTRPYRDTSALVDFFSLEHGIVTAVCRGVRRPHSKMRAILQPFTPVQISWQGRNELKTLTVAESTGHLGAISGNALICGLYANELLHKLLATHDPHPKLFVYYQYLLNSLVLQDIEIPLRIFERKLFLELGYNIDLSHIDANTTYYFDGEQLVIKKVVTINSSDQSAMFYGADLLAIKEDDYDTLSARRAAKRFMRLQIDHLLAGRELKTRELLRPRSRVDKSD